MYQFYSGYVLFFMFRWFMHSLQSLVKCSLSPLGYWTASAVPTDAISQRYFDCSPSLITPGGVILNSTSSALYRRRRFEWAHTSWYSDIAALNRRFLMTHCVSSRNTVSREFARLQCAFPSSINTSAWAALMMVNLLYANALSASIRCYDDGREAIA